MRKNTRVQLLEHFGLDKLVVRAEGSLLDFEDGTSAYDFLSQYGATPFGGNDPTLLAGIGEYFTSGAPALCQPLTGSHVVETRARLRALFDSLGRDAAARPAGEVFFTQSGAESVELALKIARAATLKPFTIALDDGFHGKTTGAVQLTANDQYRNCFRTDDTFVRRLATDPVRDLEADFDALTADGQVNAIVMEYVQGEGGMRVLDADWVRRVVDLARARGILVVTDEVQTGLGRTGTMLASEAYGVQPDLLLLAKALGGGVVPIGACVVAEGICPADFGIYHSSTFANNNFTCFVANRTLDRLENGVVAAAQSLGAYLGEGLADLVAAYPDVYRRASGLGLMRGIHLCPQTDVASYVANFCWNSGMTAYAAASWLFRRQHILTMPCFSEPSCLRLQPPLTSDRAHIDRGIAALAELGELLSDERGLLELLGAPARTTSADNQPNAAPIPVAEKAPSRRRLAPARRLQFTVHPMDDRTCLASLPRAVSSLTPEECVDFANRLTALTSIADDFGGEGYTIEPFAVGDTVVEGRLFVLNKTADQIITMTTRERTLALEAIARSAADYRADVLGLGAFTSILAGGGHLLRHVPAAVTSGSALTAYAAVHAALAHGDVPKPQSYGVVGAAGSIGSLCWQMLLAAACDGAPIRNVTLFYNPENRSARGNLGKVLRRAAGDWASLDETPKNRPLIDVARRFERAAGTDCAANADVFVAAVGTVFGAGFLDFAPTDDTAAMARLDHVLVATNQTHGIAALKATRPGARLYDIGFPLSIDASLIAEGSRFAYQAGLLACPEPWRFGRSNIAGLPRGIALGCFSETLTLAATDPASAPKGPRIKLAEAKRIGALAQSIGLQPITLNRAEPIVSPSHDRLVAAQA